MNTPAPAPASVRITLSAPACRPLDRQTIQAPGAQRLRLRDGEGRVYAEVAAASGEVVVGGSLGSHLVTAEDAEGRVLATISFRVDAHTAIRDGAGTAQRLLDLLADTMFNDWHKGYEKGLRIDGKFYRYYVSWIRDHVHSLKGMKYFDHDRIGIQSGIELYADSQREDGMIWDKCKKMLHSDLQNWRDYEFAKGDFIRKIPGHPKRRWQRIPVENDVEYLFVEGLYYSWKATGDDVWMARYLDHALRAVRYGTSDRYRWSQKHQLLKRGYTIDTWDFQHHEDIPFSGSAMGVDPEKTRFNVFHGDNTGMAASCRYLAEMLRSAERETEAAAMDALARGLQERLDALAWNGRFYRHMVGEDPTIRRDVGGTDEAEQVVQSNAYSLNRGIDHAKAVAIIDRYQAIRNEMPATSAGEFYACFPPFEKGFGHAHWNYMNGGVTTICGGELARGAFVHGREAYGADLLGRLRGWAERLDGYLHCCLKGAIPERDAGVCRPLSLDGHGNVALDVRATDGLAPWGEGDNDLRNLPVGEQTLCDLPFRIGDATRAGGKAAIRLRDTETLSVPVQAQARTLYVVHTASGGRGSLVGSMVIRYTNGTHATCYIQKGSEIESWFMPAPNDPNAGGNGEKRQSNLRVAWQGANGQFENVGIHLAALSNPHPDRVISTLDFIAAESGAQWLIAGVTLAAGPVVLPTGPVSYGIPDQWGAAAVIYALIEGQAGVVDTGVAFDRAEVSPRWQAHGETSAEVDVVYPSSGGYVSYRYRRDAKAITCIITGRAEHTRLRVLLAEGDVPKALTLNGRTVTAAIETVEASRYACVDCDGVGVHEVVLTLR